MHIVIEHLLLDAWKAWVARGGRPDAEPLGEMDGWLLRLSGRARTGAWVNFIMFTGMLAATMFIQIVAPFPPRQFWFLAVASSGFCSLRRTTWRSCIVIGWCSRMGV